MIIGGLLSLVFAWHVYNTVSGSLLGVIALLVGAFITFIIGSGFEVVIGMAKDLHYLRKKAENDQK